MMMHDTHLLNGCVLWHFHLYFVWKQWWCLVARLGPRICARYYIGIFSIPVNNDCLTPLNRKEFLIWSRLSLGRCWTLLPDPFSKQLLSTSAHYPLPFLPMPVAHSSHPQALRPNWETTMHPILEVPPYLELCLPLLREKRPWPQPGHCVIWR